MGSDEWPVVTTRQLVSFVVVGQGALQPLASHVSKAVDCHRTTSSLAASVYLYGLLYVQYTVMAGDGSAVHICHCWLAGWTRHVTGVVWVATNWLRNTIHLITRS